MTEVFIDPWYIVVALVAVLGTMGLLNIIAAYRMLDLEHCNKRLRQRLESDEEEFTERLDHAHAHLEVHHQNFNQLVHFIDHHTKGSITFNEADCGCPRITNITDSPQAN